MADKFIILPIDKFTRLKERSERRDEPPAPTAPSKSQPLMTEKENEDAPDLRSLDESAITPPPFRNMSPEMDLDKPSTSLKESLILSSLPKPYRSKAAALLKYVGDGVKWTNSGELVIEGEIIRNSHITDLLRDIQHQYKNFYPKGRNRFWNFVQKSNTPKYLIGNKHYFTEAVEQSKEIKRRAKKQPFKWQKL
jgi:hypothetical protein